MADLLMADSPEEMDALRLAAGGDPAVPSDDEYVPRGVHIWETELHDFVVLYVVKGKALDAAQGLPTRGAEGPSLAEFGRTHSVYYVLRA